MILWSTQEKLLCLKSNHLISFFFYRWLADKEDELKIIYSVLLRNSVGDNSYSQLMIAVKQLSTFE